MHFVFKHEIPSGNRCVLTFTFVFQTPCDMFSPWGGGGGGGMLSLPSSCLQYHRNTSYVGWTVRRQLLNFTHMK